MKRSKQRSSGHSRSSDDLPSIFAKPVVKEEEKSWEEWVAQPDEAFAPYSLKTHFARGTLILHPKFGKGAVIAVEGTLVVVLFAEGKKKLGHAPA